MVGQAAAAAAAVGAQPPSTAVWTSPAVPGGRAALALLAGLIVAFYLRAMRRAFRKFDSTSPLYQVGACHSCALLSEMACAGFNLSPMKSGALGGWR